MTTDKVQAAVAGASGYAGSETLRLLADHPCIEVAKVTASSNAGRRLIEVHPHLRSYSHLVLTKTTALELQDYDLVFFALPHGHSGEIAAELSHSKALLVDLASDHRLVDEVEWQCYYGSTYYPHWTYAVPELPLLLPDTMEAKLLWAKTAKPEQILSVIYSKAPATAGSSGDATGQSYRYFTKQREQLRSTNRIAAPGCNAEAVTLSLAPLVLYNLLLDNQISCTLAVGTSGAGRSPKEHLLASQRYNSLLPYSVGGKHRHIPEILQNLELVSGGLAKPDDYSLSFTPVLTSLSRGILAVSTVRLRAGVGLSDVHQAYQNLYFDEPFVEVLELGQVAQTGSVLGANLLSISLHYDERASVLSVIAAMDNLVKGTAGSALQAVNLRLSQQFPQLAETTALNRNAVLP